jgi:hypothetical protein
MDQGISNMKKKLQIHKDDDWQHLDCRGCFDANPTDILAIARNLLEERFEPRWWCDSHDAKAWTNYNTGRMTCDMEGQPLHMKPHEFVQVFVVPLDGGIRENP